MMFVGTYIILEFVSREQTNRVTPLRLTWPKARNPSSEGLYLHATLVWLAVLSQ